MDSSSDPESVGPESDFQGEKRTLRRMWTVQEDERCRRAVEKQLVAGSAEEVDWVEVEKDMEGARSSKQCRERWRLRLDPKNTLKPWTLDEDKLLMRLHAKLGNNWVDISRFLPGRSEHSSKSRWRGILRLMTRNGIQIPAVHQRSKQELRRERLLSGQPDDLAEYIFGDKDAQGSEPAQHQGQKRAIAEDVAASSEVDKKRPKLAHSEAGDSSAAPSRKSRLAIHVEMDNPAAAVPLPLPLLSMHSPTSTLSSGSGSQAAVTANAQMKPNWPQQQRHDYPGLVYGNGANPDIRAQHPLPEYRRTSPASMTVMFSSNHASSTLPGGISASRGHLSSQIDSANPYLRALRPVHRSMLLPPIAASVGFATKRNRFLTLYHQLPAPSSSASSQYREFSVPTSIPIPTSQMCSKFCPSTSFFNPAASLSAQNRYRFRPATHNFDASYF